MRTIPTLVSRLVMVTTLGAFAATLAEAQSRRLRVGSGRDARDRGIPAREGF